MGNWPYFLGETRVVAWLTPLLQLMGKPSYILHVLKTCYVLLCSTNKEEEKKSREEIMMMTRRQDERVFNQLSSLLLTILDSPPNSSSSSSIASSSSSSKTTLTMSRLREQLTPAGFASILLGVSLTLMLCGTVIFMIGVVLMPWVLTLIMVFYVYGFISTLSGLGLAIFCPLTRKTRKVWKCL